jgi:hypothetical protein
MKIILSILIIFGVFAGWVLIQHLARGFAARHPEFGAAREEGSGCCMGRSNPDGRPRCGGCPHQHSGNG